MKKNKKPVIRKEEQEPEKKKVSMALPMDERPLRFAIAGVVLLLYAVYYWTQHLFEARNFNDFGEYYLRAQDWANGVFRASGGSDILLSVVEYFAILAHPHDFLASFFLTAKILIVVLMAAAFLFVVRRNELMPDYWTKLLTIVLALSIPHFIFATVTVDQSLLFGACLLFFLSTYNIPWAGAVALMAFFSRPEAIIIVPLYFLLFFIDKKNRKNIAINFLSFILLLVALRYVMAYYTPKVTKVADYQQFNFLDQLGWDYFAGLFRHVLNFPMVLLVYAYESLQSTFLWLFFIVGLVLSIKQRQAWPFYGVLLFFLLAYAALYASAEAKPYSHFITLIKSMQEEADYFMVKAFQKFDTKLGHGRYRLVLYPAIAFFVVQGFMLLLKWPLRRVSKRSFQKHITAGVAVLILGVALYHLGVRYRPIAKEYAAERKLSRMHPAWRAALELRKQASSGAVFIDNFCDETDGSFLSTFSSYSGRDTILTRFCKYGAWVQEESGKRRLMNYKEYQEMMPANDQLLAIFTRAEANLSQMTDSATVHRWEAISLNYEDSLLQYENIRHVIAARIIPVAHLVVIDTIGGAYIHERR